MPIALIIAACIFAAIGLAVPSTICFCAAVYLWERKRLH